jgi:hypothetical protein
MNERSIHVAATVRCAKPRHEHIDVDDDDVTGRFVRVVPASHARWALVLLYVAAAVTGVVALCEFAEKRGGR